MNSFSWTRITQWVGAMFSRIRQVISQTWQAGMTATRERWTEAQAEFRHRLLLAEKRRQLAVSKKEQSPVKVMGFLIGTESGRVLSLWDGINAFRNNASGVAVRCEHSETGEGFDHEIEVRLHTVLWRSLSQSMKRELLSNDSIALGAENYCVKLLPSDRRQSVYSQSQGER